MRSYFLLGENEHIAIDWEEALDKRGQFHIGFGYKGESRTIGEIIYQSDPSCLGPEELAFNDLGAVKINRLDRSSQGQTFSCNTGRFAYEVLFFQSFSARFFVDGTRVKVHYHPAADLEILVDDVFQSALSELFYSLGGWVFHASGVSYNNRALLLMGKSGSGKSATCLSLLMGGFNLLGDDASLVIPRNGQYWAVPMAREVSVRLRSMSLNHFSGQMTLHQVGERYLWRESNCAQTPIPLAVISSLEIGKGVDTCLEEVAPQEFHQLFQGRPVLHGLNKDVFFQYVEPLSKSGVRFVRGIVGISPQATREAYCKCLEDPGRGYWRGTGGERRIMSFDEGRKLVGRCWAGSQATSLREVIALLAHPSEGLSDSAHMVLAAEPLSYLEPLPVADYDLLWASDGEIKKKIAWCRIEDWQDGARKLIERADWRFVAGNVERWLRTAPVMYPFFHYQSNHHRQLRLSIDEGWKKYLAWKYPLRLTLRMTGPGQPAAGDYSFRKEAGISRKDFEPGIRRMESLLDQAREEGISLISLTGAEPALSPWFPELVARAGIKGFPWYLTTNLLFPPSLRRWIEDVARLDIHLGSLQDYSPDQMLTLAGNLNWLKKQTFPKIFRCNPWPRLKGAWEWIANTVSEFMSRDSVLVVSWSWPQGENRPRVPKEIEDGAGERLDFVHYCAEKGIRVVVAKPYPFCALSAQEALFLLKLDAARAAYEPGSSGSLRDIGFDPELFSLPALPLDFSANFTNSLPNPGTSKPELTKRIEELEKITDHAICQGCELRNWKLCLGGASFCSGEIANR